MRSAEAGNILTWYRSTRECDCTAQRRLQVRKRKKAPRITKSQDHLNFQLLVIVDLYVMRVILPCRFCMRLGSSISASLRQTIISGSPTWKIHGASRASPAGATSESPLKFKPAYILSRLPITLFLDQKIQFSLSSFSPSRLPPPPGANRGQILVPIFRPASSLARSQLQSPILLSLLIYLTYSLTHGRSPVHRHSGLSHPVHYQQNLPTKRQLIDGVPIPRLGN